VSALVHHVLFALAVAALAGAGLRAASLAAPAGLDRPLAATVLAVAAAVLEALLLGLVGLGGSAVALALAAGATWLAATAVLPAPDFGPGRELLAWWGGLGVRERLLLGALAGALAAWTAWLVRYPALGYDTLLYHLPESVAWVQGGSPGSVEQIVNFLPVGSYPLAYEVLMGWGTGLARSFLPATLLPPAFLLLLGAAGWRCLRGLRVPRPAAALAVGALVVCPPALAHGQSGAALDPAALAWVAACAALCVGSLRRPALLAPALVAAGLAAGTKTTALPLSALALALALVAGREHLRRLARPLLAAGAAAAGLGAFWYLRNLVDHGSPFWPFLTAPWGDAAPPGVRAGDVSFLDRPGETLSRLHDYYLRHFAGGLVLLAGALVAPLLTRRREVLAAAAAALLSLLLWMAAPMTGVSDNPGFDPGTGDAVRYLLPGLGAAALALALAARTGGIRGGLAAAVLGAAVVLDLVQAFQLGFPSAPSPATPLAGALVGAVLVAGAGVASRRLRAGPLVRLRLPAAVAGALAAVVAGALLSALAPGYLRRHAEPGQWDSGLVSWFDARRGDARPVAISSAVHALLAGDRLQRRVELIPPSEPCAAVERRRARGWVVFTEIVRRRLRADVRDCFGSERPAFRDRSFRVFAPRAGGGS
jgi:hypothetical protein